MSLLADVLVPPNGEGTRATVLRWCKEVGDTVVKDEPLVELETDKVTVEIAAPADGTLFEVLKQANAEVNPDDVLARLSLPANRCGRKLRRRHPRRHPGRRRCLKRCLMRARRASH